MLCYKQGKEIPVYLYNLGLGRSFFCLIQILQFTHFQRDKSDSVVLVELLAKRQNIPGRKLCIWEWLESCKYPLFSLKVLADLQYQALKAKDEMGEYFCYCSNHDLDYFSFTKEFHKLKQLEQMKSRIYLNFIAIFYCCWKRNIAFLEYIGL